MYLGVLAPPSSPAHSRASMSPFPWPYGQLSSTSKISLADSPHRGQLPLDCPLQGLQSAPRRALPSCGWPLDLSGPHRLWLSPREVPAPSSPSSWLQLPGEAGQFPLVVNDLQLLDVSPGAGWTPGAHGLLRAWGKGEPSGGHHRHLAKPTAALSREQPQLSGFHSQPCILLTLVPTTAIGFQGHGTHSLVQRELKQVECGGTCL